MNMFDEARSLDGMIKMRKLSQNEVAKMLGVSQSYVANKLRLLGLESSLQSRIIAAHLTERHARALLKLEKGRRKDALEEIIERKLTVSESEALIDMMRCVEIPKLIGKADRLSATEIFTTSIRESLSSLNALGVKSSQKVSYYGSKMMIIICIEDA